MFGSLTRLARVAPVARAQFSTSAKRLGDGAWNYRTTPPPSTDFLNKAAIGIMTFTWWWIFHGKNHGRRVTNQHLFSIYSGIFTEPAHILPFWDNYPDPTKWTDKELGIPADDE